MGEKVSRSGKSSTRIRPRGIRRQESRTRSRSCGFEGPRPRGPVQPPPPPPPKLNIYHRGSSPFRRAPKGGELKSAVRALRMILGAQLVRLWKERFPRFPFARHAARRARHSRPAARHGGCLATNMYVKPWNQKNGTRNQKDGSRNLFIKNGSGCQKSVPGTFYLLKMVPGTRNRHPGLFIY